MNLFHVLDNEHVVLQSKGIYRQAKLYRRGDDLFAGHGNGYVRLTGQNGTSHPDINVVELSVQTETTPTGRLKLKQP